MTRFTDCALHLYVKKEVVELLREYSEKDSTLILVCLEFQEGQFVHKVSIAK